MMRSLFKDSRRPYFWCEQGVLELRLTPPELAVYCLLAARANEHDQCWPSYGDIAMRLGIGKRTAIRAVKQLCRLGLVIKRSITDEDGDQSANLYELVDLPVLGGGATVAPGSDKSDTGVVPEKTRGWCHQSTTNKEPLNKEPMNKGGGNAPPPDVLLNEFTKGFRQLYGSTPRFTAKNRTEWAERRQTETEELLRAKIASWWGHPLPRDFRGNRTFGAFLQWFDDIPVDGAGSPPGRVMSTDEVRTHMREGTPVGRRQFQRLVGELDEDV